MERSIRLKFSIAATAVLELSSASAVAEPVELPQGTAADIGVIQVSPKMPCSSTWASRRRHKQLAVGSKSVFYFDAFDNNNYTGSAITPTSSTQKHLTPFSSRWQWRLTELITAKEES